MSDALIGATGFVGGNLISKGFTYHFNSQDIDGIADNTYGTVVCAAAPGSMLEANTEPERDKARIDGLIGHLEKVRADRFVLISSIAVLADFAGRDTEQTQAFQTALAYGRHRRELEVFCADRFDACLILRLPALFGSGLKKNFIFDMLNPVPSMLTPARMEDAQTVVGKLLRETLSDTYDWDAAVNMFRLDRRRLNAAEERKALEDALETAGLSAVGFTHPRSTYQFYNLDALASDMDAALSAGLDLLHLAVEPTEAAEVHEAVTGRPMLQTDARLHHEDMRTLHAYLRGRADSYLADRNAVLSDLRIFGVRAGARVQ